MKRINAVTAALTIATAASGFPSCFIDPKPGDGNPRVHDVPIPDRWAAMQDWIERCREWEVPHPYTPAELLDFAKRVEAAGGEDVGRIIGEVREEVLVARLSTASESGDEAAIEEAAGRMREMGR
jgi:hypothetical protein